MQPLATHAPGAITLTPPAIAFIKRMVRMSGLGADAGFRLVVAPGGCSGLQETFTIERAPAAGDEVMRFEQVRLFVPATCRALLDGVTIDFVDNATQTGFVFTDPKAHSCCSSGAS